ncbi:MAG TPA: lysophospholipid acyltransferase family protein [Patescibacteria group bacterium]|nr:lysophospholipid acyltransferase family protein [Patescibacteria group bacterium]
MSASPVLTQRRQLAHIVARESAETLVGRAAGLRVDVMRRLIGPLAHQLAGRFVAYDRALGESGLRDGSAWIIDDATGGLAAEGREHIPAHGPLLIVANHPGLSDAVAILAAIGREDAWIVAADYPFLHALRLASRRFLFVSDDRSGRLSTIRRIVMALRRGETVLLFPAGGLEPDPDLSRAAAVASLATWSRSIALFARLARGTLVVPAAVRGVVSPSAFDHPLARRREPVKERQRVASLLQLALPAYRSHRVRITFGAPIVAARTTDIHAAVVDAMDALIDPA